MKILENKLNPYGSEFPPVPTGIIQTESFDASSLHIIWRVEAVRGVLLHCLAITEGSARPTVGVLKPDEARKLGNMLLEAAYLSEIWEANIHGGDNE